MRETREVSIIVPCYWTNEELYKMTLNCLKSRRETHLWPDGWPHVFSIIVDDGSPYRGESPGCDKFIRLDGNHGYPAAVNAGLRAASGDYLVVHNNDIAFMQPNWLEHLIKPLREGYGISSIRTTEPDGWDTEDKITENDIFGNIWAMTRETLQKLGYLDERFGKGYGEDLDYWHRAREAGIKIAKNHAGLADHIGKATFSTITDTFPNFQLIYKEKWGDKAHLCLSDKGVILFTDPELEDMPEKQRRYWLEHEVSLEEVRRARNG